MFITHTYICIKTQRTNHRPLFNFNDRKTDIISVTLYKHMHTYTYVSIHIKKHMDPLDTNPLCKEGGTRCTGRVNAP